MNDDHCGCGIENTIIYGECLEMELDVNNSMAKH